MHNSSNFHPVHQCNDGLFNTASGIKVSLLEPTPDMIFADDIFNALSKICRFGGQIKTFYSVAQHSVLVATLAPPELKREALLHDASEAYLGDVIKPLKVQLGKVYEDLEEKFDRAISAKFNIDLAAAYEGVKVFDKLVLEAEHEALQKHNHGPLIKMLTDTGLLTKNHWAWDHTMSRMLFVAMFHELFNL